MLYPIQRSKYLLWILWIVFFCYQCRSSVENDLIQSAPIITDFYPQSGKQGDTIVITGKNFSTNIVGNIVTIANQVAQVISAEVTQVSILVPELSNTGRISVKVGNLVGTSSQMFTFVAPEILTPTVESFYPKEGTVGGLLHIQGSNYGTNMNQIIVKLDTVVSRIVQVTPTELVIQIPKGVKTGRISVNNGVRIALSVEELRVVHVNVTTLAGMGIAGYENGTSTVAKFNHPYGLAMDSRHNLVVSDASNNRIRLVDSLGNTNLYAGSGFSGLVDGHFSAAEFFNPLGLSMDTKDLVYVCDAHNNSIRTIDGNSNVSIFAGFSTAGYLNGETALFNKPQGIYVDASLNKYIADANNHCIRKVDALNLTTTFAGTGTSGFLNGIKTTATFNNPVALAMDAQGNIYVADAGNHCIRKIDLTGNVSTFSGNGIAGYSNAMNHIQYNTPTAIVFDNKGNLYVVDAGNHCIRKIDSQGNVSTLAGLESLTGMLAGYKNGTGGEAAFNTPTGLTIDNKGILYVADYNNHVIRKIVIQ